MRLRLLRLLRLLLAVKGFSSLTLLSHSILRLVLLRVLTWEATHLTTIIRVVTCRYHRGALVLAAHSFHLPICYLGEIELLVRLTLTHIHLLALHPVRLSSSLHGAGILSSSLLVEGASSVEHVSMLSEAEEKRVDALGKQLLFLVLGPGSNISFKLEPNLLFTGVHQLLCELVDDHLVLTILLLVLIGLHVRLLVILTRLGHVGGVCTIYTHRRLSLRHGNGRNLHRSLELGVRKGRVELLWGSLPGALLTHLIHHVHLGGVHAVHTVHRVVHIVGCAALHALLQLLLPRCRHDDELLFDVGDVLVLC